MTCSKLGKGMHSSTFPLTFVKAGRNGGGHRANATTEEMVEIALSSLYQDGYDGGDGMVVMRHYGNEMIMIFKFSIIMTSNSYFICKCSANILRNQTSEKTFFSFRT